MQRIIGLLDRSQNLGYENSLPMREADEHNWDLMSLQADHPIFERFVRMERIHVSQLELLYSFKEHVVRNAVLSGDEIHNIFLNLDRVLDMHRRFLIAVERMYSRPHQDENLADLFLTWMDSFAIIEPYASNQANSSRNAMQNYRKLRESVSSPGSLRLVQHLDRLSSFLSEPIEHLKRYQWFLGQLDDPPSHENTGIAITEARGGLSALLQRITEHAHKEKSVKVIQELNDDVVDWKHHRVEAFGHLLLHGVCYVEKPGHIHRMYRIFLFEEILCLFKEMPVGSKKRSGFALFGKAPQDINPPRRPRLHLKGRIFMQNVTHVLPLQRPTNPHACQIFWKGGVSVENFVIVFPLLSSHNGWASAIDHQRRVMRTSLDSPIALEKPVMQNPYAEISNSDGESTGKLTTSEPSGAHLTGSSFDDGALPPEITVKVYTPSMAKTTVTLEIKTTITYSALLLRIVAHASNFRTPPQVSADLFKLNYFDDGDFVLIKSDEDVQTAFETWWEVHQENSRTGTPEEERLILYLDSND